MAKAIRKSLPKQIAEMIEEKIQNGEFEIGDKLPPEPSLMEIFGVSRNTVREAIQSLTNCGLLETRQGDGTYVVAKERLQVDFFKFMNSTDHENVLEVRELLEKHVAMSAMRHADEKDLEEIERRLRLRNLSGASIREATQADMDFHMAIAQATHNEIVLNIYRYVAEYFNEFIYEKLYDTSRDQQEIDEIHETLLEAIRTKNGPLALSCVDRIVEL